MTRSEPWCPTCVAPLVPRRYESTSIWGCARCGGAFLPDEQLLDIALDEAIPRSRRERLVALAAAAAGPVESELAEPTRQCPWCTRRMRRRTYEDSAIVVDQCYDCAGVWLDGGELQQVEAWTEAVRAGTIPPPRIARTQP